MEIHLYIFPISRGPLPPEIWPTFKRFSCADGKICIAFSDLQLKLPHLFLGLFHLLLLLTCLRNNRGEELVSISLVAF